MQVLEMALAEAERRVAEAKRYAGHSHTLLLVVRLANRQGIDVAWMCQRPDSQQAIHQSEAPEQT